jgi:hypothetical protein
MNRKLLGIAVAILAITLMTTPVMAKNLNLASNVVAIKYGNGGGNADFSLATPLQVTYFSTTTGIQIKASHIEIPNADLSYDNLVILLWSKGSPTSPSPTWQPIAVLTTNPDEVAMQKDFWKGTWVNFDIRQYSQTAPLSWSTKDSDNIRYVDPSVFSVERHGNSAVVNLNQEITIKKALWSDSFTLPKFTLTLSGYGESIHFLKTTEITGYLQASGESITHDELRFNANGALSFPASSGILNGATVSNGLVNMKQILTIFEKSPV